MIHAQQHKMVNLTPPAALVDNTSWTVAELDTKDWDYAQIYVILGATDIAMAAFTLTESDTTGSGHANVTGGIFGTSANLAGDTSALPTATDDNDIFCIEVDLRKRKRFLDLTLTAGDGTSGTYACVIAILSRGRIGPDTAAERGCNQILRV